MSQRLAILVGNGEFTDASGLAPLKGPRNDVAALSEVLSDEALGNFKVLAHVDDDSDVVLASIEEALDQSEQQDTILIYYSGHGVLDKAGRLCLATRNTSKQLKATSICATQIAELVDTAKCNSIVLILDCCYSGAMGKAILKNKADSELVILSESRGLHVLTASTATQAAVEAETDDGGLAMGKFSRAIVDGIRSGNADVDGDKVVSLTDLRLYIAAAVDGQKPQYWATRVSGRDPEIAYVRTAAVVEAHGLLERNTPAVERVDHSTLPKTPSADGFLAAAEWMNQSAAPGQAHRTSSGAMLRSVLFGLFVLATFFLGWEFSPSPKAHAVVDTGQDVEDRTFALDSILFDPGSTDLDGAARVSLHFDFQLKNFHPPTRIQIVGMAGVEGPGDRESAVELAERRGQAVYDYLVNSGVNPDVLSLDRKVLDVEDSASANRVDFVVLHR